MYYINAVWETCCGWSLMKNVATTTHHKHSVSIQRTTFFVIAVFQLACHSIHPLSLNRVTEGGSSFEDLYASIKCPVLYINIYSLFFIFGELMWICLCTQGSIQKQTGRNPSESLCLTWGFAPAVSSLYTNTHRHIVLYADTFPIAFSMAIYIFVVIENDSRLTVCHFAKTRHSFMFSMKSVYTDFD